MGCKPVGDVGENGVAGRFEVGAPIEKKPVLANEDNQAAPVSALKRPAGPRSVAPSITQA